MLSIEEIYKDHKVVTDKHLAVMNALHEKQCEAYREQITTLKAMNSWYIQSMQTLFKKYNEDTAKLKLDPSQFWERPSFGGVIIPDVALWCNTGDKS